MVCGGLLARIMGGGQRIGVGVGGGGWVGLSVKGWGSGWRSMCGGRGQSERVWVGSCVRWRCRPSDCGKRQYALRLVVVVEGDP